MIPCIGWSSVSVSGPTSASTSAMALESALPVGVVITVSYSFGSDKHWSESSSESTVSCARCGGAGSAVSEHKQKHESVWIRLLGHLGHKQCLLWVQVELTVVRCAHRLHCLPAAANDLEQVGHATPSAG